MSGAGSDMRRQLKEVHVQINWLLESKSRTQSYANTFKERLKSSFGTREIVINVPKVQKARSHENGSIGYNRIQEIAP
jgi:hypothetical protein